MERDFTTICTELVQAIAAQVREQLEKTMREMQAASEPAAEAAATEQQPGGDTAGQFDDALKTEDAALLLGVSKHRLYHLVRDNELPHYRHGHKIYFSKAEIERWLLSRRVPTNKDIKSQAAAIVMRADMLKGKKTAGTARPVIKEIKRPASMTAPTKTAD